MMAMVLLSFFEGCFGRLVTVKVVPFSTILSHYLHSQINSKLLKTTCCFKIFVMFTIVCLAGYFWDEWGTKLQNLRILKGN